MKGIAAGRPARRMAAACAAALALVAPGAAPRAGGPPARHPQAGGLAGQAGDALSSLEQFVAGLDPLMVETVTPVLAHLIESSRDEALAQGVQPIPEAVRNELAGYVPGATLDRVRWCVQCGGALSLQRGTFLFQYAPAITLDYVVVFEKREDALGDPSLWAHELKHVMQYRQWGVEGFAKRYLEDYEAVESEAAEYRWQWMERTHYLERRRKGRGVRAGAENALK